MTEPLRALIGMPFNTRHGGSENILWTLLRNREQARLEPHVWFYADGPFRAEVDGLGIPTSVIEPGRYRQPWKLAAAVRQLAGLMRETRPDLCISWLDRVQSVTAPAAMVTGNARRVVCWEHIVPEGTVVERALAALPCRFVVADSLAGSEAHRRMWPHRDGTHVWPGIEPPERASDDALAELRRSLALPDDRPVVGIVGRLVEWKGQDKLIEAVALLRDRGVDVTLLVVGGETHGLEAGIEQRLRDLASTLGLEDRVVFCGHVPSPHAHVQLMDVFVCASDGEPFGLVVLEGMALGVPVVAVDKFGPSEIVENGVSGVLTGTNAPGELADAVGRLVADPDFARRVAAGGRARFEDRFTARGFAEEIGRTLARVAADAPPRGSHAR